MALVGRHRTQRDNQTEGQRTHMETLGQLLALAQSNDPQLQSSADAQLREEERRWVVGSSNSSQGPFPALLCQIATETGVSADPLTDASVRLLAAITLKRLIEQRWRPRGNSAAAFSENVKSSVKDALLNFLCSESAASLHLPDGSVHPQNERLELQLCLCTATIAKFEDNVFESWPELLPSLCQIAQNACTAVSVADSVGHSVAIGYRVGTALHHTLALLSSLRHPDKLMRFQTLEREIWSVSQTCVTGSLMGLVALLSEPTSESTASRLRQDILIRSSADLARRFLQISCTLVLHCSPSFNPKFTDVDSMAFKSRVSEFSFQLCELMTQMQQQRCELALVEGDSTDIDVEGKASEDNVRICCYDRVVIAALKYFAVGQRKHPMYFAPLAFPLCSFLGDRLCFAVQLATGSRSGALFNGVKFNVAAMLLLESILRCKEYRCRDESPAIVQDYFTLDNLRPLTSSLVSSLVVLPTDELQKMRDDPESYVVDVAADNLWQHSPRGAAIHLLQALLDERSGVLSQFFVNDLLGGLRVIRASLTEEGADIFSLLVQHEAIFSVLSECYFALYDDLDFESWFLSELADEISEIHNLHTFAIQCGNFDNSVLCSAVERAIAAVLGNWVAKIPGTLHAAVYDIVVNRFLCNADLDDGSASLLVAMGGMQALTTLVNDFEFVPASFSPFASNAFIGLFNLMSLTTECQSKLNVLHSVRVLCTQLEGSVVPFVPSILELLLEQWRSSVSESDSQYNLLRQGVVRTVTALSDAVDDMYFGALEENESPIATAQVLQHVHEQLAAIALPLVAHCADPDGLDAIYLLEDGIQLWSGALQRLPTSLLFPGLQFIGPDIYQAQVLSCDVAGCEWISLLPRLIRIIDNSELLEEALRILQQYLLHLGTTLCFIEFPVADGASVNIYAGFVAPLFEKILGNIGDAGVLMALKPLESLVMLTPMEIVDPNSGSAIHPLSALLSLFEHMAAMLFMSCAIRDSTDVLLAQLPSSRNAEPQDKHAREALMKVAQSVPNSLVAVGIINVFARLVVHHGSVFSSFWGDFGTVQRICEKARGKFADIPTSAFLEFSQRVTPDSLVPPQDPAQIEELFTELWLELIDQMGPVSWKKLSALALYSLFSSGNATCVPRGSQIYAVVRDAVESSGTLGTPTYSVVVQPSASREERFAQLDPVNSEELLGTMIEFVGLKN